MPNIYRPFTDRCSEIERQNRVLLEKMTCILAGQGENFPQHQKVYMPPIPDWKSKKHLRAPSGRSRGNDSNMRSNLRRNKGAVTKSLNQGARNIESQRIALENEQILKRLQEKNSVYNVYDWEHQRKKQENLVRNICYHPPGILRDGSKKNFKRTSSRRGSNLGSKDTI